MIWFLTRGRQQVDVEIRRAPDSEGYELVLAYPDGTERIERYEDASQLVERTLRVQRRLMRRGWRPTSPFGPEWTSPPKTLSRGARVVLMISNLGRAVKRRLAAAFGL
jgi:hypothetical protein